jgi:hypothetical protein
VSGAGDEPAGEEDEGGEHGLLAGKGLGDLLRRRGHRCRFYQWERGVQLKF